MTDGVDARRALVVGLGVAGEAAARALIRHGIDVVVVEDHPGPAVRERAGRLGVEVVEAPDRDALAAVVAGVDLVVPSPPVPPRHPVFGLATGAGVPLWSEFELAARWGHPPIVAITGTNGKTTVTTLVTEMLTAAGRSTVAAGNNDVPLVDVIDAGHDVIVVEASSFRLELTETFRPAVATWLNLAEDHLDWHPSMEAYAAAKARIWAAQDAGDVAIANAEDPAVMAAASSARGRVVTFGLALGDYRVEGDRLVGPAGDIAGVDDLWRDLPHERANALAAAASALEAGAAVEPVRAALRAFRGLPHRVELIEDAGGVAWYDDSKATDPHAAVTAVRGFEHVVLIAGGRNKGLDLGVLAGEAARLRHVVAIGEAAGEVRAALAPVAPVTTATSMDEAVAAAAAAARPGDVVLLSPGCASFDWYGGYAERGDDFARAVRAHLARAEAGT